MGAECIDSSSDYFIGDLWKRISINKKRESSTPRQSDTVSNKLISMLHVKGLLTPSTIYLIE